MPLRAPQLRSEPPPEGRAKRRRFQPIRGRWGAILRQVLSNLLRLVFPIFVSRFDLNHLRALYRSQLRQSPVIALW